MKIDHKIFCIWSGDNQMSDSRKLCFDSILKNSGVAVELITPEVLDKWILPESPIHQAYQYLSLTHKADYLRAYLMHHYGGGYSDIKYINFNWNPYFDIMNYEKYLLFVGYPEKSPLHIAAHDIHIRNKFYELCGCCHFIMRPYSEFTTRWMAIVDHILDNKLETLKKYPGSYHPRAVYGGVHGEDDTYLDSKYPLSWNEILGKIIHSLMYDYIGNFLPAMPNVNLSSRYR